MNLPDDPALFDAMARGGSLPSAAPESAQIGEGLKRGQMFSAAAIEPGTAQQLALLRQDMAAFAGSPMSDRLEWKHDSLGAWM